jgi:hypothetical protein
MQRWTVAREKAPAYQRYPKQIMGDDKVLLMDWDAYGMHNWLLDTSWQQDPRGTIPDDQDALRRWLRLPRNIVACARPDLWCRCNDCAWRRVWPQISAAWPVLEGGRRGNAGMIRCAERQANYSKGNRGKEKYANGTQIERGLVRKSTEDEDVIETATLEYETKLEAFDPEKYVRRIQAAWKWPHVDYSPLVENEILKCFEDESVTHSWPRIESAHYVTERVESIAKIVAGFEEDAQKFLPGLVKLMNTKAYRSPDKDWERKGPKKRGAAAPTGRPKW